ncbi:MAG TPA: alpha/beta fold hydrolase [Sphingomicrobium sp.]|nr:alpha/beta fold hydrolase [Sphingomicrobium sp.]
MQQSHAPRPLPLFLELVRIVSQREPALAAKALEGLARYEQAPRENHRPERPAVATIGPASLRDCGGSGRPVVLVPSLINPPSVLDLDDDVSLANAIARLGRRVFLLDWGKAVGRSDFDLGGHVESLLLPLLRELDEPPALVGYCLGGTIAMAAANLAPVERVATLAAPWRFSAYPAEARQSLERLWAGTREASNQLGALPMEVLQGGFWSLDPERTVSKFARYASFPPDSAEGRRFVTLEDWANEGEPLPCPAARELIEGLFGGDLPGTGDWRIGGRAISDRLDYPMLNITAANDRITPAATAPAGDSIEIDSGHVGMVVGSARAKLHKVLADFLSPSLRA